MIIFIPAPPSSYRKSYAINSHANDVISLFYGDITKLLIDVIVYSTDIYVNNAHGGKLKFNSIKHRLKFLFRTSEI